MSKREVPNHIANFGSSIKADHPSKKQQAKEKKPDLVKKIENSYTEETKQVLDPTLLDKSFLERMPQPTGWRILILPYRGKAVTDSGIILTKSTIDQESLATVIGYVVKMGPDCYADANKFAKPWCQEKQWVLIGRYAGARFKLGDESECRIINDDEVIATILSPDDIHSV